MPLFIPEPFTSHSGLRLNWKVDCDALSDDDLAGLAEVVQRRLSFRKVHGIPRGGTRFAAALRRYERVDTTRELIVDDVLTTGVSFRDAKRDLERDAFPSTSIARIMGVSPDFVGVAIFARGPCPDWVYPIFRVEDWIR